MKNNLTVFMGAFLLFFLPDAHSQSVSEWDKVPADIKNRNSFKRLEWFYRPRMNELGIFPREFIEKQKEAEYSKLKMQTVSGNSSFQWTSLGPVGIDFSTEGMAPQWGVVSGRVRGLAIHPSNPDIVYAGSGGGGIWKTTNGGNTWVDKSGGLNLLTFGSIAIDPSNPEVIYAGTGEYFWLLTERFYSGDGLYKSTNGGDNWVKINADFGTVTHFTDLAVSPHNPNILIAAIAKNLQDATPNQGIWRSADAGLNWTRVLPLEGAWDVAFHPTNPDHVFLGNVELSSSTNGSTFSCIRDPDASGGGSNVWDSYTHLDHHVIRFAPSDSSVVYVGCDGGVFKSTDAGLSFHSANTGIASIQSYRVASHISNPDIIYSGAQDNGFISTHNRGLTPYKLELLGDGTECFMDYSNPDIIFFATYCGYFGGTTDGGQSWDLLVDPVALNDSSAFLCPYWQHPTNPNIIYGCLKLKLYKSTDKGNTWAYTTSLPITSSAIYSAAQSPIETGNIMVAARNGITSLVRSSDGGYQWQDITGNLGALSGGNFMRLQADPVNGNTFYLLKNSYTGAIVLKTTDFGSSWTDISSDLPKVPVNDLFIDTAIPGVMYLGNDFGVYRTTNSGSSWTRLNNGMPFIPVLDFDYFNSSGIRLLRAATFGRGVFELNLNQTESVNENRSEVSGIDAWPNPASDKLWVDLPAFVPDKYTLTLISVNGQEVASRTVYTNGISLRTNIAVSELKPGWYQLVLKGNREFQTSKVMIVR